MQSRIFWHDNHYSKVKPNHHGPIFDYSISLSAQRRKVKWERTPKIEPFLNHHQKIPVEGTQPKERQDPKVTNQKNKGTKSNKIKLKKTSKNERQNLIAKIKKKKNKYI